MLHWTTAIVAFLLLGLPASSRGADREDPRRPNIILFVVDDLAREDARWINPEGAWMPATMWLAHEGVRLKNFHSVAPICTPSRYSMLTGQYPSRTRHEWFTSRAEAEGQGVVEFNTYIQPGQTTVASILREAGYSTALVGKNHVIHVPEWKKGNWDDDPREPAVKALLTENARHISRAANSCGFDEAIAVYHNNPDYNGIKELAVHNMDWIASGAIDFITRKKDNPFFLYIATTVPHLPEEPERGILAGPRLTSEGVLDEDPPVTLRREGIPATLEEESYGANLSNPRTRRYANILWMDNAVRVIKLALENAGIADNTVILFMSDHGMQSKGSVYDGGTRTAAFVWKKGGFQAGRASSSLLSTIDVAPTICDLAGIPVPQDMDGRSMLPVLEGREQSIHEELYFEAGYTRGILKNNWKYIALRHSEHAKNMTPEERKKKLEEANQLLDEQGKEKPTEDPMAPFGHLMLVPGGGHVEQDAWAAHRGTYFDPDQLFNLADDPMELKNLAGEESHADQLAEMKSTLRAYLEKLPYRFPL